MIRGDIDSAKETAKTILIVSHKEHQCGVYQFGRNIAEALAKSVKYSFLYEECSNAEEYRSKVNKIDPAAIIYNHYYSTTMPWLTKKVIHQYKVPHIGIIHEVTQRVADLANDDFFDFHIAPDPTLLLKNPLVFKTGRLVPQYENNFDFPTVPTFGSFGFGTAGKGFDRLISTIQDEFDEATIRLHIPFAAFGDPDGTTAQAIAKKCQEIIVKPGVKLQLSHEFLSQGQLLDFLAQNSLNAFFYEENKGRGISSVIDAALAVQRPIAISKSAMFRHIASASPSVCIEDATLKQIMQNGSENLAHYCREWSEANLIWDYERILDVVLVKQLKTRSMTERVRSKLNDILKKSEVMPIKDSWSPTLEHEAIDEQIVSDMKYRSVSVSVTTVFNRILDDAARQQYQSVIAALHDLLPDMMARKIPEANIQQAFVLDAVQELTTHFETPAMLCIGSYDDTAAAALKKYGYRIDEVDPVLNYDLNTFMTKPSTVKGSYDIVFSTSVIEHVRDDELFVKQIAELLAPGGTAVLTCDYNDQYKLGSPLPSEDFRFYTQKDFTERLLPVAKNCYLLDSPQWNCPNPDFIYAGCQYTFATFVFRKSKS